MNLEIRKSNKAEKAAYVENAIENARTGNPAYEGSLDPTGSTVFYHNTTHAALEHFAELYKEGWTLIHEIPACYDKLHAFSARKPPHVFKADIPKIAARAEARYEKEILEHNAAVRKQQQRNQEIIEEFERREAERKALLLAEIAREVDARHNPRFDRADRTRLHA